MCWRVLTITMLMFLSAPKELKAQLNIYSFEELDSLKTSEERPVIIFIHTEWCKYCLKMKKTTLENDQIIKALNEKFYFVSLDAEFKNDISFLGRTFKYLPRGHNTGVHELAKELATIKGKLNYPTLTVLNTKNEIVFQNDGYLDGATLKTILSEL